jgi:hypothetical protein
MSRECTTRARWKRAAWLFLIFSVAPFGSATAGPPYLSDDPQPTDPGHWEIYNYVTGLNGEGGLSGLAGFDLNYGAAKDLQLTAVLPVGFSNVRGFAFDGLRGGPGDVELAVKYRPLHQSEGSWMPDVAAFPRLFVPTGGTRFGSGHAQLLLPVWAQKDFGPWSVFGGGGYQINPGAGQRNFWQGGVAITRDVSKRLNLGVEGFSQGDDTSTGGGFETANFALIYKLVTHWSLLVSGGPTWDHGGGHGQVFYFGLKADY